MEQIVHFTAEFDCKSIVYRGTSISGIQVQGLKMDEIGFSCARFGGSRRSLDVTTRCLKMTQNRCQKTSKIHPKIDEKLRSGESHEKSPLGRQTGGQKSPKGAPRGPKRGPPCPPQSLSSLDQFSRPRPRPPPGPQRTTKRHPKSAPRVPQEPFLYGFETNFP